MAPEAPRQPESHRPEAGAWCGRCADARTRRRVAAPWCLCSRGVPAGRPGREPVARLPREPQRAGAGCPVHRGVPRVLRAGAGGCAQARRARPSSRARADPQRGGASRVGRSRSHRRRRQRSGAGAGLRLGAPCGAGCRGRPRRGRISRRHAGGGHPAAGDRAVLRCRRGDCAGRGMAARARRSPGRAGPRTQERGRAADVREGRLRVAWRGAGCRGCRARPTRTARRHSGVRVCRDRVDPGRRHPADAARGDGAARSGRHAPVGAGGPRACATARRARAGDGEPVGHRRELFADGRHGHHGGLVPPVGGPVAERRAARGLLLPHLAYRRYGLVGAGIRGPRARVARRDACRVPAQRPAYARPGSSPGGVGGARPAGGRGKGAADSRPGSRPQRGRPAGGVGQRGRGSRVRLRARHPNQTRDGRAAPRVHCGGRLARLRAAARGHPHRPRRLRPTHRRPARQRRVVVACTGRG